MTHEYTPLHHRSPAEIRDVRFTHRLRGLDEYEVSEFLDLLAEQVRSTEQEVARLREANRRLEAEVERLRAEVDRPGADRALGAGPPGERSTPHAAALLLHAQEVADALVEEAVRRTREILDEARAEQRAMLRAAERTAAALLAEARDTGSDPRVPRQAWRLDSGAAV